MEIREINVRSLDIPELPSYLISPTVSLPQTPPVTTLIGTPIIDIPGCVEAHESNNSNDNLIQDDPRGVLTFCDSGLPSFNPIQFEPNRMILTPVPQIPKSEGPKPNVPPTPEINPPPVTTAAIECPTPLQDTKEPVGTYINGYRDKIIEYKLIGNECVQITESVGIPQQIIAGLPSGGQVASVGGIAVIATTSALIAKPLADILLKVVKPTIKKLIKKIAKMRGKETKVLSLQERRELQRERTEAIRKLRSVVKPK
jgi:hypothetical protein